MPIILAKKLAELSESELISLLRSIEMEDREAYNLIKEKLEEII